MYYLRIIWHSSFELPTNLYVQPPHLNSMATRNHIDNEEDPDPTEKSKEESLTSSLTAVESVELRISLRGDLLIQFMGLKKHFLATTNTEVVRRLIGDAHRQLSTLDQEASVKDSICLHGNLPDSCYDLSCPNFYDKKRKQEVDDWGKEIEAHIADSDDSENSESSEDSEEDENE